MSLASQINSLATRIGQEIKAVRTEMAARAIEPYTFAITGTVPTTATGKSQIVMEVACTVETVRAAVGTTPTTAVVVDVNKNGATIYGTQGNRPSIAPASTNALGGVASGAAFAAGDVLSVDVDAGAGASDLTVTVRMRRT